MRIKLILLKNWGGFGPGHPVELPQATAERLIAEKIARPKDAAWENPALRRSKGGESSQTAGPIESAAMEPAEKAVMAKPKKRRRRGRQSKAPLDKTRDGGELVEPPEATNGDS